jgi:hypothetical protein
MGIGIVVIPQGTGQSGPVTGSTTFFVNQTLDVQGKETNTTGDLVLSSSTVTVSGNLNVLGTINAPVSGAAPTGSLNYFVTNQLDVRGYLTNSVGSAVVVSGNMTVLGALNFNSSSLTGSGGAAFTNSGSYLLTASFNTYSASVNTFSSSVNAFTASQTATNTSTATSLTNLNLFSASVLTYTGSVNTFSASVNTFTSSQTATNSSTATALTNLNTFSASMLVYSGSVNAFSSSVNAFTSSQTATNSSTATALTNLNLFSSSLLLYTGSVNTFSSSILNWSGSLTANYDLRYLTTASFTDARVVSMVTGTLDTRYSGSGGGIGGLDPAIFNAYSASVNTFSASVNAFTASQATTNATVATHTAQIASLNTFSASVWPWTGSINTFTASQTTTNTSTATSLTNLNTFSASMLVYTGSVNTFSSSILTWSGSVNTFTASIAAWSSSLRSTFDARYVLTSSFTNAQVVSMVTGTLDTRYSGSGGGGGGTATFSGTILQISESAGATSPVAQYGQLFVNTGSHQLGFMDSSGTLSQLCGMDTRQYVIDEDFLTNTNKVGGSTAIGQWFTTSTTGGGLTGSAFLAPVVNHPGILTIGAGGGATSYAQVLGPATNGTLCAGHYQEWQAIVMIPSASAAGLRFVASVGTTTTGIGGTALNGMSVQYTDNTFAGNWYAYIGGLTFDLGVAMVPGAWTRLGCILNAACTTGSFFINGNLVYSVTNPAQLPASGDTYHLGAFVTKSTGTTAGAFMHLDRLYYRVLASR